MWWDETTPDYILLAPVPLTIFYYVPIYNDYRGKNTIIVEHFLHIISWQVISERRKYHHRTGCMESEQSIRVKKLVNLNLNCFTSFVIISVLAAVFFLKVKRETVAPRHPQTHSTLASLSYTSHHANDHSAPASSWINTPRLLPINLKYSLSFQTGNSWDEPKSGGFFFSNQQPTACGIWKSKKYSIENGTYIQKRLNLI